MSESQRKERQKEIDRLMSMRNDEFYRVLVSETIDWLKNLPAGKKEKDFGWLAPRVAYYVFDRAFIYGDPVSNRMAWAVPELLDEIRHQLKGCVAWKKEARNS